MFPWDHFHSTTSQYIFGRFLFFSFIRFFFFLLASVSFIVRVFNSTKTLFVDI